MITHINDFLQKSVTKFWNKNAFVEFGGRSITYKEFDHLSKKIASEILSKLPTKSTQEPVLIILPKGIDCLLSFFGVAKSGNFYTLLDEKSPKERVEKVIEVLKPKLLITSKKLNLDFNLDTIFTEDFESFSVNENTLEKALNNHIDTNLLYVLFTSGSTGVPKGVSISHRSVIDYIIWVCETFKLDHKDTLANQVQFYFDVSVTDIFATIHVGGTLHLIPNDSFVFPGKVMRYLAENKITTIFWVPSVLIYFANEKSLNKIENLYLNKVLFAGEIMPNKQLNIWRKCFPNALFANLYGPTEVTVISSFYIVNRKFNDDELLPIGKACKNIQLLVFDEELNLINPNQVGVKGELYVKGTCLSLGYYSDEEKTKQVFVQNPLHDNYLDLLYKTGDVVAYNEFGELLCYGRMDYQIKYMGHRIELGEIESVINSHDDVRNCVCIFKEEIICFYESKNEIQFKNFLKDKLPVYMIPKKFVKINQFVLNASGKIDRKILNNLQ
ncbi:MULTISPECIES: amino acid adenylation domain-containing protein [Campylobacter]|uniref:amino acid adenylation domain-containing protein n=1 Tax=Campylobacter TaxID=194 RepID=UPI0003D2760C|nr:MULTISPECIES: amino acid adenylation domain-containing protein [Campylobacter]KDA36109.1 amino acid adenylation protein [Campylobacter jejuni K5]EII8775321.1 amino acid adenylation domain-containing protein [Campylobacter coli]ETC96741.1 amino acid adenylation protein [Campylobacter coli K7]MCH3879007.1 amino acid adenylation domain-containing protein [Campylobacter jejuni]HEG0589762.1 amino acid adenylation domain-containing protein [Campylobacter coli]